jgi:5S rRNA maturation endonuclease (ribonuclease M5)
LHAGYFESFEKVILFLDLDLGGLQIANALKNLVPSVEMTFFMAPNTEQLLSAVIGTQKSNYLEKVIGMAEKQPFLRPACRLIIKHKKVLEQEAYL